MRSNQKTYYLAESWVALKVWRFASIVLCFAAVAILDVGTAVQNDLGNEADNVWEGANESVAHGLGLG